MTEPVLDQTARDIAVHAVRVARSEGCDCHPDVEVSPTADPPFWFPVVRHDESCSLVWVHRLAGDL